MTYAEATAWLFSRFPAYQILGVSAYKPDLFHVKKLLDALGNPHTGLDCIHIAGTNGKGSTSHILAALCQTHGLKTGIFTSPHLVDFRERIKVDGREIPESEVIRWVESVIPSLNIDYEPSFFELTFALAINFFKETHCQVCIIETGLGGRLDATNILQPKLSVITNIGLDHQNFLGNTRPEIATEKAGIIKSNTPVLIAERDRETEHIFLSKVQSESANLRWVTFEEHIDSDLLGAFQQLNLHTAKQAFEWFCNIIGLPVEQRKMQFALTHVATLTGFKGRMQFVQEQPKVIFDVAHNVSGIRVLLHALSRIKFEKLHLVFGTSSDKDLTEILPLLPKEANYYLCEFKNTRSRKTEEWEAIGEAYFPHYEVFSSPIHALDAAKKGASAEDLILVFGSFFLIGELFESLGIG